MLTYQEDASSINNISDVTNTESNERSEDTHIFHKFFVNVDKPDSAALKKAFVLGEIDAAIFEQDKKVKIHAEHCNHDESW